MFSGIAQFVREHWHNIQVSKVKAHLAVDEAPDEWDRYLRQGNEWADFSAKAAVSLHPSPLPEELEGLDKSVAVARAVGRLGAKLLSLWPRLSMGKDVELNKEAPVKEQVPPPTPHQWHWVGSYWQCATCLRGRRGRPSVEPLGGACSLSLHVKPSVLRELGHRCVLIDCSDGSFICICHKCGYHTSGGRLDRLGKKCDFHKVVSHSNPWSRLQRGLHPSYKKVGVTVDVNTFCKL